MKQRLLVVALAAALVLVGCGKGNDENPAGAAGNAAVQPNGAHMPTNSAASVPTSPQKSLELYQEGILEAVAVARTVKDEASAKAAAPAWVAAMAKMKAAADYWSALTEEQRQIHGTKMAELGPATMELGAEMSRIVSDPVLRTHFGVGLRGMPRMK